jgi:hypothetical protein
MRSTGLLTYGLKGIQGISPFCKKYIYPSGTFPRKKLDKLA